MAIPKLTDAERIAALEKAQEMRSKRTALRKDLKQGKITLPQVLEETEDEVITRMKVKYLLESLPNVGKITAAALMSELNIKESRRVQGLGKRQREKLLEKLA